MATARRCPVCRVLITSTNCMHCPECGAALDRDRPAARGSEVNDIIKTVRQQISALDDQADAQSREAEQVPEDGDIEAILSGLDFQEILKENRSDDEISCIVDAPALKPPQVQFGGGADSEPPTVAEDRPSPFGRALGSLQQKQVWSAGGGAHSDELQSISALWNGLSAAGDGEFSESVVPYPGPVNRNAQPEVPKKRTWWGCTRQTFWLLFVLLVCIALFRMFLPEKKEPTIEDFFRPGNPEVKFLDAIDFLEKYYERHPELKSGTAIPQDADAPVESMQPLDVPDRSVGGVPVQAPDNATSRGRAVLPVPADSSP